MARPEVHDVYWAVGFALLGERDGSMEMNEMLLIHIRDQWETAMQEVLRERGYVFQFFSRDDGRQEFLWYGPPPDAGEMTDAAREAALRCGCEVDDGEDEDEDY